MVDKVNLVVGRVFRVIDRIAWGGLFVSCLSLVVSDLDSRSCSCFAVHI